MPSESTTTRDITVDGHVFKYFVSGTGKIRLTDIPEEVKQMPSNVRDKLIRAAVEFATSPEATRSITVDGHVFKYFVAVTGKIRLTDIPEEVMQMPSNVRDELIRAAVEFAQQGHAYVITNIQNSENPVPVPTTTGLKLCF